MSLKITVGKEKLVIFLRKIRLQKTNLTIQGILFKAEAKTVFKLAAEKCTGNLKCFLVLNNQNSRIMIPQMNLFLPFYC